MYIGKVELASSAILGVAAFFPQALLAAEIEEIAVTAQRRSERLLDVPISVTVLGAGDLLNGRIRSPQDMTTALANVEVGEPQGNAFAMFVIRGVGLNDYNVNNNPTVGVYRDDVFLSSNAMIPKVYFDLARIEVLKGPQGALYGRNSTAGAINLVSASPGNELSGYASLGYGNFETLDLEGAVGGPLSERAGARVAGYAKRRFVGHQFNRTSGKSHGELRSWSLRGTATFDPTEALGFRLVLNGGRDNSDIFYYQHRGVLGPQCKVATQGIHDPANCADLFGYRDTDGDENAGDYSRTPRAGDSTYGATFKAEMTTSVWILTAITNAERFKYRDGKEEDSAPQTVIEIDYDSDIRQLSQEVRLASNGDTRFSWILGGMAGHYRHEENRRANIADFEATFGPVFGSPRVDLPYLQITKTAAVFADAQWKFTPKIALGGGVRYTSERISYEGGTSLPLLGVPVVQVSDKIRTDKISWRANVTYAPADRVRAYASVSTGFKSGGFFGGFAFAQAELQPYRPETVTAYELGAKTEISDGLSLHAATFIYDYKDLQALAISTVGTGGAVTISALRNLPGAAFYGADIEASWKISTSLTVRGAFGLLDTRIKGPAFSYGSAGANGPAFDLAGNEVPRAPHVSSSVSAVYTHAIGSGLELIANGNIGIRTKTHMDLNNFPMATQPAHALLSARAAIASEAGWQIAAWGKNLTNVIPLLGDGPAGFGERDAVGYGMPRTYGIEARLMF